MQKYRRRICSLWFTTVICICYRNKIDSRNSTDLGIWYSSLVQFAALGMGLLMAGAVTCHLKTRRS